MSNNNLKNHQFICHPPSLCVKRKWQLMLHNPFQPQQEDQQLRKSLLHNRHNLQHLNRVHQTAAIGSVTPPTPVPGQGPNTALTPPSQPPPSPARHRSLVSEHRCRIILKFMISLIFVPPPTTSLPSATHPPLHPNRGDARSMAKM